MFRRRTKAIGWKPRKKEAGPEMQGTRYWRFRIPPPPPSPCTGCPFYNCLPFRQLRTSTRIHRLFSVVFIGSPGIKATHRAGAGMVRFVLTTLSPLKRGPKNTLKEKEKWKRVSTLCIHLPVRQNIAIISQIIRKPRYFFNFSYLPAIFRFKNSSEGFIVCTDRHQILGHRSPCSGHSLHGHSVYHQVV